MPSRRDVSEWIATRLLAGDDRAELMQQLAAYLVQHKLTKHADVFIADIERQLALQGTIVVDVTSARGLDDELRAEIKQQFKDAHSVTLREHIDESLIGGVIIKTPTHEYDASLSSALKRLRIS